MLPEPITDRQEQAAGRLVFQAAVGALLFVAAVWLATL